MTTGSYIVWFWVVSNRSGPQALADGVPFQFFEGFSQTVQNAVAQAPLLWGLGLAGVAGTCGAAAMFASRSHAPSSSMANSREA